jgi:hypothetical protein
VLLLALGLILLAGCDDDTIRPAPGTIFVSVVDVTGPPVPDVEVRIAPLGLSATTDAQGVTSFSVPPGDYVVEARVCCRGPVPYDYHVPVTVTAWQTTTVVLRACLYCQ